MCSVNVPEPKAVPQQKPDYLRNPYLDDQRRAESLAAAGRVGRSTLRIPLDTGLGVGFGGARASNGAANTAGPRGNSAPRSTGNGSLRIGGSGSGTRNPEAQIGSAIGRFVN